MCEQMRENELNKRNERWFVQTFPTFWGDDTAVIMWIEPKERVKK